MQHGARYCFPATQGGLSRGVPTGYAASPLSEQIRPGHDPPPVWPWKKGTARGISFHPLYPSVPEAAERNPALGELLALFDAVRGGSAREQALALALLLVAASAALHRQCSRWIDQLQQGSGQPPRNRPA